jgi:outer membrane protein assembly factor BamA
MKRYFLIFLVGFTSLFSYSQDTIEIKSKIFREFKFIPLPILGSNPTSGWLFGVAPSSTWFLGDKSNTNLSSLLGAIIYTTNEQFMSSARANTYFSRNKIIMYTDIRYFITSQPTYGFGTGPQSAKPIGDTNYLKYSDNPYKAISTSQMLEFNFLRIHNTMNFRYKESHFYWGLGYHLDKHMKIKDNLLNLDTTPPIKTSHYWYCDSFGFNPTKYTLSGLSLNFLFDNRDNVVNPYSGRYAFASLRVNPEFLGSDVKSSILWLEYRDYLHISKTRPRHLIGFWGYGWFVTSGNVPYMDAPAVGWDLFGRSGRGYTQGRFRGKNLIYTELEYRFPLQRHKERFGGVVFINSTTADNPVSGIKLFEYNDYAYGAGLRFMVDKKSRANLTIDYAIGKYGSQGFYFGINEVF